MKKVLRYNSMGKPQEGSKRSENRSQWFTGFAKFFCVSSEKANMREAQNRGELRMEQMKSYVLQAQGPNLDTCQFQEITFNSFFFSFISLLCRVF